MTIAEYLLSLNAQYRLGDAAEQTLRGGLQDLLDSVAPGISELERQACGEPDGLCSAAFLDFSAQTARGLGLAFLQEPVDSDQDDRGGEVCFAESKEVRPEYRQTFTLIDLLDYIYAVMYRPSYRETYEELLKLDFPSVPYPNDAEQFWKMAALGRELRRLHLMESPSLSQYVTQYPVGGENEVKKIRFEDGRVYINSDQYFDFVPAIAWSLYIGRCQPAQKWLKDRKGQILNFEDIMRYQRIIKALTETYRVMKEIDRVGFMEGG